MKLTETKKEIYIAVFKYKIVVIRTNSILASCKKWGIEPLENQTDENTNALTAETEKSHCFIFFKKDKVPVTTLCHEVYHAVEAMFRWIGAENLDEEVVAYSLGYLVGEIDKFINK